MLEYRIIKTNNSALKNLGADNWQMCWVNNEYMYFSREVKKTKFIKTEQTKEYLLFKELYPKKSWITSTKIINKINNLVKEKKFEELINGINKYIKFIKVNNYISKFILNPETFLNNERRKDEFDIIENKIWASESWINPFLKDLDSEVVENVMKKKKERQKQFPNNKLSEWVMKNIIDSIINK